MDHLTQDQPEYGLVLRIIRIELSKGRYENLITIHPDLDIDLDDFKDLYHLRWNEEIAFRDLKYPLCLKDIESNISFLLT